MRMKCQHRVVDRCITSDDDVIAASRSKYDFVVVSGYHELFMNQSLRDAC